MAKHTYCSEVFFVNKELPHACDLDLDFKMLLSSFSLLESFLFYPGWEKNTFDCVQKTGLHFLLKKQVLKIQLKVEHMGWDGEQSVVFH